MQKAKFHLQTPTNIKYFLTHLIVFVNRQAIKSIFFAVYCIFGAEKPEI